MVFLGDLPDFQANRSHLACGLYKFHLGAPEVQLENGQAGNPNWCPWKPSEVINQDLVKRITSIQLFTKSRDQGHVDHPQRGNWTWFDLSIGLSGNDAANELVENQPLWMSHENRFMSRTYGWSEGKIFTDNHEFLKALKEPESERCIKVQMSARFRGWKNYVEDGYLVITVGCERLECEPIDLPPDNDGNENVRRILAAGPERATFNKLLTRTDMHWTTENRAEANPNVAWEAMIRAEIRAMADQLEDQQNQQIHQHDQDHLLGIYKATSLDQISDILKSLPQCGQCSHHSNKRVLVIIDADDLRNTGVDIKPLSWDRIMEDLWDDLKGTRVHLLIRLGYEATVYKGPEPGEQRDLVFVPGSAEGQFLRECLGFKVAKEQKLEKKRVNQELEAAYIAGLTASLAKESKTSLNALCATQIKTAIANAMNWARRFAAIKYLDKAPRAYGALDWHTINSVVDQDPPLLPVHLNVKKAQRTGSWILRALPYPHSMAASDIVKLGADGVLPYMPTAEFGALRTADRGEIDGFREVAMAIQEYLDSPHRKKPLSIAIFGKPGSGKSFGVKEIIEYMFPGDAKKEKEDIEFNLSQFQKESDLERAFDRVRDCSMSNKLPIVYFDEFDVTFRRKPLFWLEHFFGPIEQGISTVNNKARALGRGIYFFIGGTASTLDEFKGSSYEHKDSSDSNVTETPPPSNVVDGAPIVSVDESQANTKAGDVTRAPSHGEDETSNSPAPTTSGPPTHNSSEWTDVPDSRSVGNPSDDSTTSVEPPQVLAESRAGTQVDLAANTVKTPNSDRNVIQTVVLQSVHGVSSFAPSAVTTGQHRGPATTIPPQNSAPKKAEVKYPMKFGYPKECADVARILNTHLTTQLHFRTVDMLNFKDYGELLECFRDVRDFTSSKQTPVVFFKNFDSDITLDYGNGTRAETEHMGWLKYFLSPMQDGKYYDHGYQKPLGKAVFVFVEGSGKDDRFQKFPDEMNESPEFKNAKGPDFLSRLRGYVREDAQDLVNVIHRHEENKKEQKPLSLGVFRRGASRKEENTPQKRFAANLGGAVNVLGPNKIDLNDREYIIRRAILLKAMITNRLKGVEHNGKPITITNEFVKALLMVRKFNHGSRSMEAILAMSAMSKKIGNPDGQHILDIESLPLQQLKLHTDVDDFLECKQRTLKTTDNVEETHKYVDIEWLKHKLGKASTRKDLR